MNEKNIIEITSEGLTYMDENGERQFIDFAACYQRYADQWSEPVYLKKFKEANPTRSDEELEASIEWMRKHKEVGGRDFTVPFIEFYTDPPTKFYFASRDEYDKVVYLVRKAKWRLFDWA
ncbi:MAG: hypothetical protein ABI690_16670 [Chloroflexota bacterium]